MKPITTHSKREVLRVNGNLKEIVTVHDEHGKLLHKIINPIMLEFQNKDVLQIIIGATLLAIPIAFTEETWNLGRDLPLLNVFLILILSLFFLGSFIFYNYYKTDFFHHRKHFF